MRARYYAPEQGRFITRDTWEGNNNSPQTLNRYVYTVNNPILFTDPSGNCPIPILCQVLIGGAGGAVIGATLGAAYASFMYDLAVQGRCGCEGIQIIQQYTKSQFVLKGAGQGALFGAVFGALASMGAGGQAVAALGGLGFSSAGIVTSAQRLLAEPNNECAWWDLGLSLFGLVASGFALGNAASQFNAPRNALIPDEALIKNSGHLGDDAINQISVDSFYNRAVKNPSSDSILIGKYHKGSSASYEQIAARNKYGYIDLETPIYKQFLKLFGGDENAWWNHINEPYIRKVVSTRKTVYITENPIRVTGGNLAKEVNLLTKLGYVNDGPVNINGVNLWKMIPGR